MKLYYFHTIYRVLFFGLIILFCLVAIFIRKKKARKNRITHSMFLERLRERIEHQIIEEAGLNSTNNTHLTTGGHQRRNLAGIYYNAASQNIGIGSSMNTEGMVTPVGNIPTHLFLANRAPPAYTEHENRNTGNGETEPRSEAPPSYESIFDNNNNNSNNNNEQQQLQQQQQSDHYT